MMVVASMGLRFCFGALRLKIGKRYSEMMLCEDVSDTQRSCMRGTGMLIGVFSTVLVYDSLTEGTFLEITKESRRI